ncbi:MAG: hypothetical protein LBQ31_03775 [Bacteroidales bacterium]|nr:hypothetical protein [Bacteroidales bacterium]
MAMNLAKLKNFMYLCDLSTEFFRYKLGRCVDFRILLGFKNKKMNNFYPVFLTSLTSVEFVSGSLMLCPECGVLRLGSREQGAGSREQGIS